MVEIRRVDAQGSPKDNQDALKVFSVKIWTDEVKYHFSFEGNFYHCKKTGRGNNFIGEEMALVEPGTKTDLENFGVQKISEYCINQVKEEKV